MRTQHSRGESGVASTVGTMLTFVVVLTLLSSVSTVYVPARMKDLEYAHMEEVRQSFQSLRSGLMVDLSLGGAVEVPRVLVGIPIPLGSDGLPGLAEPSPGALAVDTGDAASVTVSYDLITGFDNGSIEKVDQDVVLIMDSSGSMRWNDPEGLRHQGAADYIGTLSSPDRVAIVDFDHRARLVRRNVGGEAHHLFQEGHGGNPDYQDAIDDLGTIDSWGGTNFGRAMWAANDELISNGDENHTWVEILLTDGWNNRWWYDWWAQWEAIRAKENGILLYTIGLGNHDARLLRWMAEYTGGTYYSAPSAEALRWIYYDISRNFQGGVRCPCVSVAERAAGTISLEVQNRYYVPQTVSYENGAVITSQPDGAVLTAPPDIRVSRTADGGARMSVRLASLLGTPSLRQGAGTEILRLNRLASSSEELVMKRISLQELSDSLVALRGELDYWFDEGAVTYESKAVLQSEILDIESWLGIAIAAQGPGNVEGARNAVRWAMNETDDAVFATSMEAAARGIQEWLADSVANALAGVKCRLSQWMNWADGVTLRVTTPHPVVWGEWLNATLREARVDYSMTFDSGGLTVRVHAVGVLELRTVAVEVTL